MSIHFLPSAIIHCLLLLLQLTQTLFDSNTLRYWTIIVLALLSVNPQQSPNSFANLASTRCFNLCGWSEATVYAKSK
jgi:hypothetical protein